MLTVRVDAKTEAMIERVARRRRQTKSEVVRDAFQLLAETENAQTRGLTDRYKRVAHVIGCYSGGKADRSTNTGRKFRELLLKRARERGSG